MNVWFGVFTPKGKLHAVEEGKYIAAEIAKSAGSGFSVRPVIIVEGVENGVSVEPESPEPVSGI